MHVQVYGCTDLGVHMYSVKLYGCTGVQVYGCTSVWVCRYKDVQVYKCLGVQMHRCTSVWVYSDVQLYR